MSSVACWSGVTLASHVEVLIASVTRAPGAAAALAGAAADARAAAETAGAALAGARADPEADGADALSSQEAAGRAARITSAEEDRMTPRYYREPRTGGTMSNERSIRPLP